jgi:hypothetical protein
MDRSASPTISGEPAAGCSSGLLEKISSVFSIGGVAIRLAGKSSSDVALNPSLQPYRSQSSAVDVDIGVEWADKILPSSGRKTFDSGTTWRLRDFSSQLEFDLQSKTLGSSPYARLTIDDRFRRGTLQMSEECFARLGYPAEPLGYPLDELLIMHRLTQERAIELHGTGIVRANGVANLFVGHSGAGKSTTTRLWTSLEEVEVLSDDRIIVRLDNVRCDGGRGGPTRMRMYGTPWHGEAMFASPNSAPLTRIFVLEHGHGNMIARLSPSEAVGELFARAFVPFHRHEYLENALSFLEQLVSSVPCYRYSFEPDERAVEKIQQFND